MQCCLCQAVIANIILNNRFRKIVECYKISAWEKEHKSLFQKNLRMKLKWKLTLWLSVICYLLEAKKKTSCLKGITEDYWKKNYWILKRRQVFEQFYFFVYRCRYRYHTHKKNQNKIKPPVWQHPFVFHATLSVIVIRCFGSVSHFCAVFSGISRWRDRHGGTTGGGWTSCRVKLWSLRGLECLSLYPIEIIILFFFKNTFKIDFLPLGAIYSKQKIFKVQDILPVQCSQPIAYKTLFFLSFFYVSYIIYYEYYYLIFIDRRSIDRLHLYMG